MTMQTLQPGGAVGRAESSQPSALLFDSHLLDVSLDLPSFDYHLSMAGPSSDFFHALIWVDQWIGGRSKFSDSPFRTESSFYFIVNTTFVTASPHIHHNGLKKDLAQSPSMGRQTEG